MINACVVGYGVVGQATANALGIKKHFDINGDSNITLEEAANCRYVFLCLPTPTVEGTCFTLPIREIIKQIEGYRASPIYIVRSTVTPGTADSIMDELDMDRVISNPEFLSEDSAQEDAKRPAQIIIGGKNSLWMDEVKAIYEGRFKYLEPKLTDNKTAELVKYAFNTFFVTKVVFANQIYDTAHLIGANYEFIKDRLMEHPWGSKNHFEIFHKGARGAGGKCLPKDLEAFTTFTQNRLFKTLMEMNGFYGKQ